MGFFSWMTADTNESIASRYSDVATFTVCMRDNADNVWIEVDYEGYGVFGGKDYYELVAEMNREHPAIANRTLSRDDGITLAFLDDQNGIIYPTLSRDPNFEWTADAKPKDCPHQGYFYNWDLTKG